MTYLEQQQYYKKAKKRKKKGKKHEYDPYDTYMAAQHNAGDPRVDTIIHAVQTNINNINTIRADVDSLMNKGGLQLSGGDDVDAAAAQATITALVEAVNKHTDRFDKVEARLADVEKRLNSVIKYINASNKKTETTTVVKEQATQQPVVKEQPDNKITPDDLRAQHTPTPPTTKPGVEVIT